MARYAKVDRRIWFDARFRSLTERGKLVFLFELTHPSMTMLGAMRATIPGLAAELEIPMKAFHEAFGEALAKGIVKYDLGASLLWFPNFLKYNRPESPNVVRSWPDAFELIPECGLKCELFEQLKAFTKGLSEGFQEAFTEGFPKGYAESVAVTGTVTVIKNTSEASLADQHHSPSVPPNGSLFLTAPELPAVPASRPRAKRESSAATELDADVDECFSYFKKQLNKRESYKLDKKGRAMGIEGLKACAELAAEYGKEDPSRIAVEFLKEAINRMTVDKFHNGENDSHTKYLDWEHLFRGKNKPCPRKLTEYWLDDNRVA